jgi:hypothetical protein
LFVDDAPGFGELDPETVITDVSDAFNTDCGPALDQCAALTAGDAKTADSVCATANSVCVRSSSLFARPTLFSCVCFRPQISKVFNPAVGDRLPEDLRQLANSTDIFPSSDYLHFIRDPDVMSKIGATTTYDQCDTDIKARFDASGEVHMIALDQRLDPANTCVILRLEDRSCLLWPLWQIPRCLFSSGSATLISSESSPFCARCPLTFSFQSELDRRSRRDGQHVVVRQSTAQPDLLHQFHYRRHGYGPVSGG